MDRGPQIGNPNQIVGTYSRHISTWGSYVLLLDSWGSLFGVLQTIPFFLERHRFGLVPVASSAGAQAQVHHCWGLQGQRQRVGAEYRYAIRPQKPYQIGSSAPIALVRKGALAGASRNVKDSRASLRIGMGILHRNPIYCGPVTVLGEG